MSVWNMGKDSSIVKAPTCIFKVANDGDQIFRYVFRIVSLVAI